MRAVRLTGRSTPMSSAGYAGVHAAERGAGVSLVFYAGHGIEIDGVNYLVPVDARL